MSLLKKETICKNCNIQYILVVKEEDIVELSCCPFCTLPIESEEAVEGDDE